MGQRGCVAVTERLGDEPEAAIGFRPSTRGNRLKRQTPRPDLDRLVAGPGCAFTAVRAPRHLPPLV